MSIHYFGLALRVESNEIQWSSGFPRTKFFHSRNAQETDADNLRPLSVLARSWLDHRLWRWAKRGERHLLCSRKVCCILREFPSSREYPAIPYWKGTPEEYNKLYDYTVDAVRRALPNAKVGGPATTGPARKAAGDYLRQFLEHCANGKNFVTGKTGTPLDFITFHAKGQPKVVDGHVQMGLLNNLRDVDEGLAIVASFPKFASLPIVLSESVLRAVPPVRSRRIRKMLIAMGRCIPHTQPQRFAIFLI